MKSGEILKSAERMVEGLITDKTPAVFDNCRSAYVELGELVAFARSEMADGVTTEFAAGINDVIKRIDPYRAVHSAKLNKTEKKMTVEQFAGYLKQQIAKALAEEPAEALRRLHALQAGIRKAYTFESTDTVSIQLYVDPWQMETTEDGVRTSGAGDTTTEIPIESLTTSDVTTVSAASTLKAVADMIEKSVVDAAEMTDIGWELDLATPKFLRGERSLDFGKDGSPAK